MGTPRGTSLQAKHNDLNTTMTSASCGLGAFLQYTGTQSLKGLAVVWGDPDLQNVRQTDQPGGLHRQAFSKQARLMLVIPVGPCELLQTWHFYFCYWAAPEAS